MNTHPWTCKCCGKAGPLVVSDVCPSCYGWAVAYVKWYVRTMALICEQEEA